MDWPSIQSVSLLMARDAGIHILKNNNNVKNIILVYLNQPNYINVYHQNYFIWVK